MAAEGITDKISAGIQGSGSFGQVLVSKGSKIMGQFWWFFKIAFYLGVVAAVILAFYQFYLRYKDKIILYITSGGRLVDIQIDKAMTWQDNKTGVKRIRKWSKYKGMWLEAPLVEGKFKYISGKKDTYMFWLDDNLQLQPCQMEISKDDNFIQKASKKLINRTGGIVELNVEDLSKDEMASIKARPQDRDAWASMERQRQDMKIKTESPLLKYAQIIMPIAIVALCFLMFYFWMKQMGSMANSMAGALNAIAENCLK